jgi:putative ABC transport system permease protein
MDSHIEAQYRSSLRWLAVTRAAATLAIVVACFGVFGLAALAAHRRRKELSIRRVLGARSRQLMFSFYREFALLTLIGAILGMPLAYWVAQRWSAEFVYRAAPSPWPFVIGGAALLCVVLATVTLQAARAASSNIAELIRCE